MTRRRRLVDVGEALAIINARQDVSDDELAARAAIRDELARLSGDAPEIICPACSATIRARMADSPQQLAREYAALCLVAVEARDTVVRLAEEGVHLGPLRAELDTLAAVRIRAGMHPAPLVPHLEDYVSTGDPADDHMIEGIPVDSAYQDTIEREDWRDRYRRSNTVATPDPPARQDTAGR
jgi:hypothetical protein